MPVVGLSRHPIGHTEINRNDTFGLLCPLIPVTH